MTAKAQWHAYLKVRERVVSTASFDECAKLVAEAEAAQDAHFAAVDVEAFCCRPTAWVFLNEPDHRPVDPTRCWHKKKPAF